MVSDERGVILEIDGRDAVVLTPAGDFRRVRLDRPGRQVGEEIPLIAALPPRAPRHFFWPGAATVVAAAALLALVVLPATKRPAGGPDQHGTTNVAAQIMAYVTVDINPSFEMAVDGSGRVVDARALNGDAEPLLALADVTGRPVDEAVDRLAEVSAERGFLAPGRDNNVVIAAVPAEGGSDVPPAVREQVAAGRNRVKDTLARRALAAEVVALAAPAPELKTEAAQAGLSVGKYLIWLEMQKAGLPATAEDLRDQPIGKLIKGYGLVPGEVIRRAEKENEMDDLIKTFRERLRERDSKGAGGAADDGSDDGSDGGAADDGSDDGSDDGESRAGRKEDRRDGDFNRGRDRLPVPGGEGEPRGRDKDKKKDEGKERGKKDDDRGKRSTVPGDGDSDDENEGAD